MASMTMTAPIRAIHSHELTFTGVSFGWSFRTISRRSLPPAVRADATGSQLRPD